MVEMTEANQALQEADEHSLIIFDEIGRGTSTYDGMALAQAMMEYIACVVKAKTLFSTHYHELTSMERDLDCVINEHVAVNEKNDDITFLYRVDKGPAGNSYGINVAHLAGLPASILKRAKAIHQELEQAQLNHVGTVKLVEINKEDPCLKAIKDQLLAVDMDDLSPKKAWDYLCELQDKVRQKDE